MFLSPKQKKPLPKFLTEEEIRRLIAAAKAHDDCRHRRTAVMMELMYACGLRVFELVSLPENCLNYDKRQIMVKGKGSKELNRAGCAGGSECRFRIYGVSGFLLKAGRKSVWLFPSKVSSSGHVTRDAFFKNIQAAAIEAGLPRERVNSCMFCVILCDLICLIMTLICVRYKKCSAMKISARPKFIRISFQKR